MAGTPKASGFVIGSAFPIDDRTNGQTSGGWANLAAAKAGVTARYKGLVIDVQDAGGNPVKYWWKNGVADADLIPFDPYDPTYTTIANANFEVDFALGVRTPNRRLTGVTANREITLTNMAVGDSLLIKIDLPIASQNRDIGFIITGTNTYIILATTPTANGLTLAGSATEVTYYEVLIEKAADTEFWIKEVDFA